MFRKNPAHNDNEQEYSVQQLDAKVNELKDATGPLSGSSANYCTDSCLRRYLEAWGWNVNKTKKMLEETLSGDQLISLKKSVGMKLQRKVRQAKRTEGIFMLEMGRRL